MAKSTLRDILLGRVNQRVAIETSDGAKRSGTLTSVTDNAGILSEHASREEMLISFDSIIYVAEIESNLTGESERQLWPPFLTNEAQLNRERNRFIIGVVIVVALGIFVRLTGKPASEGTQLYNEYLSMSVLAKAVLAYLVFRLSRFLREPLWASIILAVVSVFAFLWVLPLVVVLSDVAATRDRMRRFRAARIGLANSTD